MDKPAGREKIEQNIKLGILVVMTLWGGIGVVCRLTSGLPLGFGSAYAAGYSVGTILLFLMFGFGVHGLYKRWQAKKGGA